MVGLKLKTWNRIRIKQSIWAEFEGWAMPCWQALTVCCYLASIPSIDLDYLQLMPEQTLLMSWMSTIDPVIDSSGTSPILRQAMSIHKHDTWTLPITEENTPLPSPTTSYRLGDHGFLLNHYSTRRDAVDLNISFLFPSIVSVLNWRKKAPSFQLICTILC